MKLSSILNPEIILHSARMLNSFEHWTGKKLIEGNNSSSEISRMLFEAPFVLMSHGTEKDPIFKYANKKALELFEMSWEEFTAMPSRFSAEPIHQDERAKFMERVTKNGFVDDYEGIRISSAGRRFKINHAIVWNVLDEEKKYCGQAATFSQWEYL